MAYGADPDTPVKDDWETTEADVSSNYRTRWYNRRVWEVLSYFLYHPNYTWHNRPNLQQRDALAAGIKRLLEVYPPESIKMAIDRFYMTRTSKNHPEPGFAFLSRRFQDVLFKEVDVYDDQDAIMKWTQNDFERDVDTDLPWDAEFDQEVAIEMITTPIYNVFLRTYPDIVAEILKHYHDDDWMEVMDQVCAHHEWLLGLRDEPSMIIAELQEKFHLPKDFLEKGKMRTTQPTVEEAARIARGR